MGKSYRKFPMVKHSPPYWRRFMKKQASKKVRQTKEVNDYAFYKKVYPSYLITDMVTMCPADERPDWMSYDSWARYYLRK